MHLWWFLYDVVSANCGVVFSFFFIVFFYQLSMLSKLCLGSFHQQNCWSFFNILVKSIKLLPYGVKSVETTHRSIKTSALTRMLSENGACGPSFRLDCNTTWLRAQISCPPLTVQGPEYYLRTFFLFVIFAFGKLFLLTRFDLNEVNSYSRRVRLYMDENRSKF